MAQITFGYADQGYSPYEVDHYIDMLQQEYANAVGWSEELEKQLSDTRLELEKTKAVLEEQKKKNEQLLKDCRALAVKLNDFSTGKVRIEDLYNERDRLRLENEYLKSQLNVGSKGNDDVLGRLFSEMLDSIEASKRDAQIKSTEAIAKANERASAIIKNANQRATEISSKSDVIFRSLENIYDVIGDVLEGLENK
ncbi:MAG: hypothetical protein MJ177_04765 [Clostridia bacterium]|nr:hypothetical protein [Clostridia bacterium]